MTPAEFRRYREQVVALAGNSARLGSWTKVLAALPAVAADHDRPWTGDSVLPASQRHVAGKAGVTRPTAARVLADLDATGYLPRHSEDYGPEAAEYRTTPALVALVAAAQAAYPKVCNIEPHLDHSPTRETQESPSGEGVWPNVAHPPAHPPDRLADGYRHGALSPTLVALLRAVAAGYDTAAAAARANGYAASTGSRGLRRLESFGLVAHRAGRWVLTGGRVLLAGGRRAAALLLGLARMARTAGRTAIQRERHRREREVFRRWWAQRRRPPPDSEPPEWVYELAAREAA